MAQSLPVVMGKAYAMHTTYVGTYISCCIQLLTYISMLPTCTFSKARVVMQLPEYGYLLSRMWKKIRKSAWQSEVGRVVHRVLAAMLLKIIYLFILGITIKYISILFQSSSGVVVTCILERIFFLDLQPVYTSMEWFSLVTSRKYLRKIRLVK